MVVPRTSPTHHRLIHAKLLNRLPSLFWAPCPNHYMFHSGGNPSAHDLTQRFSHNFENKWKCQSLSCVWLFATPWTVAHQAPLSMEFSRQKYWSGLSLPSPGDLTYPGFESASPHCRQIFMIWTTREALACGQNVPLLSVCKVPFHSGWPGSELSQFISLPAPSLSPWVSTCCSPRFCLYFCIANEIICTVFIDSTYMR